MALLREVDSVLFAKKKFLPASRSRQAETFVLRFPLRQGEGKTISHLPKGEMGVLN
jgi:hypothetical protein